MHAQNAAFVVALSATAVLAGLEQAPAPPDAVVDLRTQAGAVAVGAHWSYTDAHIIEAENFAPGPDHRPTDTAAKTHDIHPRFGTPDFEHAPWRPCDPGSLETRRTSGRLAFAWYRLDLAIPESINGLATAGSTVILDLTVDDYAEVWLDGSLPQMLGQTNGPLIRGWNAPTRITITRDAQPGQPVRLAIFAANGPLSAPPANYVWIRSATLNFYTPGHQPFPLPKPVPITVIRAAPELDEIIPPDATAEKLAEGFSFTEGPVWIPQLPPGRTYGGGGTGNYLLFSDPNRNIIHRWDPQDGETTIFRTSSGYSGTGGPNIGEYRQPGSNGLALSPDGRLTICEHGNRRVTRLEPDGSITVLADNFEGRRLNSPNDLVYRSDGALFFTDPPFGLPQAHDDPRKELPFSGVFCLHGGTLRAVATDFRGPNGLALSPDEKFLYVGNWDEQRKVIIRYEVAPDGSLRSPTTLVDLTVSDPGDLCFDGLKTDAAGNLYAAAPGGLRVYSAHGKHLGTIELPELPANCSFGDADGRTLFITARTGLYRLRTRIPGRPAGPTGVASR